MEVFTASFTCKLSLNNAVPKNMTTTAQEKASNSLWQWQANLQLQLTLREQKTRLTRCRHQGPLYVQKPFYPEGPECAHVYLLHPPGGMVSGDTLDIHVDLQDNAHSVVTTPGAARAYRARPQTDGMLPTQEQNLQLTLANNATLEWFPMETIIYDGAAAELNTHIELHNNSTFIGWEVTCLGLPASQQLMTHGHFTQRYKITRDGLPLFIDHLHFDANNQALFNNSAGMQGKTVSGFFIASNDQLTEASNNALLETIRHRLEDKQWDTLVAVSNIRGFYVCRYLGSSANEARNIFTNIWDIMRPEIVGRDSCHPRIWKT